MRKTAAIQALGYPVLLALIYAWFGIGDRSAWQLLLSAVLGCAIVFGAVWLIASALAAEPVSPRRLGGFLLWIAAAAAVVACCVWLVGYRPRLGFSVASHLTQWFRKPVKPQTMGSIYAWLIWIAGVAGVLAILPLAVKARPTWRYWTTAALLAVAGLVLPGLLVGWVPKFESFGAQTASMVVRFALAYAIALASWLAIAASARRSRSAAIA
jgi:hypothetical protein